MRKAIVMGMVAAAATSAGCARDRNETGGPTVERDYQVGGFERIEVAGSYDVESTPVRPRASMRRVRKRNLSA